MSIIKEEEVAKLGELAKLPLDAEMIKARQKDLEEILEYVKKLSEIDLKGVDPVPGGTDLVNSLRADELDPSSAALNDALIACFPNNEARMAKVPSVFGK